MIPVVFSALAMNLLVKLPWTWVYEVASSGKFLELWKELVNRNMQNVDISTKAALREMMLPGILTIDFLS
jgi:K(+)-stimulated pyrophosphate-energized sodium pump